MADRHIGVPHGGSSGRARVALGALVVGYALLDLVAGAPDSPLVPALPPGVAVPGWMARGATGAGLDRLGRTELTVLALALVAVVIGTLAVVLVEAWRGRVRTGAVLVCAALSLGLSVAAPPLLSRDLYSYAAYGRIWARYGSNPYLVPPSAFPADPFVRAASAEWRDTPSLYGPAFVLLAGAISRASAAPDATVFALKALAGAALWGAGALAARAAGRVRPGRGAFAAAALGLNPVLVVHAVGGGHSDALIALCLSGALVLSVRRNPVGGGRVSGAGGRLWGRGPTRSSVREPAGLSWRELGVTALLTVAVLVKVVVAPALLVWVWGLECAGRRRRLGPATASHLAVAVGLGALLFAPFLAGWRTLSPLVTLAGTRGWASGPGLVARGAAAAGSALAGPGVGRVAGTAISGAFLVGYVASLWRLLSARAVRARGATSAAAEAWGPALLLLALAAPYLLPWYAAWFLPFVAVMDETRLVGAALGAGAVLAMTGIPAEPGSAPDLWNRMVLGVHYGAAPLMLALLGAVAAVAVRSSTAPSGAPAAAARGPKARAAPVGPPDPGRGSTGG